MLKQRRDRRPRAEAFARSKNEGQNMTVSKTSTAADTSFGSAAKIPPGHQSPSSADVALAALRVGAGNFRRKAAQEEAVKELQRSDPEGNALWWAYCEQYGGGLRDPCKHTSSFLQKFLADFVAGNCATARTQQNVAACRMPPRPSAVHQQTAPEAPSAGPLHPDRMGTPSSVASNAGKQPRSDDVCRLRQSMCHTGHSPGAAPPPPPLPDPATIQSKYLEPIGLVAEQDQVLLNAIQMAGLDTTFQSLLQVSGASASDGLQLLRHVMLKEIHNTMHSMTGKAAPELSLVDASAIRLAGIASAAPQESRLPMSSFAAALKPAIEESKLPTSSLAAALKPAIEESKLPMSSFAAALKPAIEESKLPASSFAAALKPAIEESKLPTSSLAAALKPAIEESKLPASSFAAALKPAIEESKLPTSSLAVALLPAIEALGNLQTARSNSSGSQSPDPALAKHLGQDALPPRAWPSTSQFRPTSNGEASLREQRLGFGLPCSPGLSEYCTDPLEVTQEPKVLQDEPALMRSPGILPSKTSAAKLPHDGASPDQDFGFMRLSL